MAQPSSEQLPDDPDALKAMISDRDDELYAKSLLIEKLKHQLVILRRGKFGASSESLDQLDLLFEEMETEQAEVKAASPISDNGKIKQQPKRKAFPADIPRQDECMNPLRIVLIAAIQAPASWPMRSFPNMGITYRSIARTRSMGVKG